jgi:hypothetical protein
MPSLSSLAADGSFPAGGIERTLEDGIEALVRDHDEAATRVEHDVVGMRTRVLGPMRAGPVGKVTQVAERHK